MSASAWVVEGEPASTSEPNLSPHMATQARLINAPRRRPSPYHAHGTHTHNGSTMIAMREAPSDARLLACAARSLSVLLISGAIF